MTVRDFINMTINKDYNDFILIDAKTKSKYMNINKYKDCEVVGVFPVVETNAIKNKVYAKIGLSILHDNY